MKTILLVDKKNEDDSTSCAKDMLATPGVLDKESKFILE
jgi:hypothetical protein